MAEGKKSFIAYTDWKEIFNSLPNETAGKLVKHIFAYVTDENPESDDFVINAVFAGIKSTLKRDLEKWDKQHEQRRNAAKKSVESRRKSKEAEIELSRLNERSTSVQRNITNDSVSSTDSVSVSVSVSDSVILLEKETKGKKNKKKRPPLSVEELLILTSDLCKVKKEIISEFLEYKKDIGQELTYKPSIVKYVNQFKIYSIDKCRKVVNESIKRTWDGLYFDKVDDNYTAPKTERAAKDNEICYRWKHEGNRGDKKYVSKEKAEAHFKSQAIGGYIPVII